MTSSLVGSEMCIRDSCAAAPCCTCRHPRASLPPTQPRHATPALPCVAPVSYTHLTLPTICSV
eukprot:8458196-Prorocentrum_lima.AAC.1